MVNVHDVVVFTRELGVEFLELSFRDLKGQRVDAAERFPTPEPYDIVGRPVEEIVSRTVDPAHAPVPIKQDCGNRQVLIHLRGGDLTLHWDQRTQHVFMTDEAREVFSGNWP